MSRYEMKEKLAAGYWISARPSYTPVYGEQAPCVYLRPQVGHTNALTPREARELAELLIKAADYAEGL